MSLPTEAAASAPPDPIPPSSDRFAEAALLVATLVWGGSFTWAKAAGDALNHAAGAAHGAPFGPLLLMGARFFGAGLLWLAIFPSARRGFTRATVARGTLIGAFMAGGLVLQVLGLDRTSEAVSAFLTSLTIIWVPAILTLGLRRPPPAVVWLGVILAAVGVWLMTAARASGFGVGEVLGLGCSIAFSLQIIAVNLYVPRDCPARITGVIFLLTGLTGLVAAAMFAPPGHPPVWSLLNESGVRADLVLLILFPTLVSYGAMNFYQPRVEPTRATLIYLMEPIVAAAYAWWSVGRRLGTVELLGGGLIFLANLLVEVLAAHRASRDAS